MRADGISETAAAGVALLKRGAEVIKFSRSGKPAVTLIHLSEDESMISWKKHGRLGRSAKDRSVALRGVSRLDIGRESAAFQAARPDKARGAGAAHLSLSLVLKPTYAHEGAKKPTLDLCCSDEECFGLLVAAFRALLGALEASAAAASRPWGAGLVAITANLGGSSGSSGGGGSGGGGSESPTVPVKLKTSEIELLTSEDEAAATAAEAAAAARVRELEERVRELEAQQAPSAASPSPTRVRSETYLSASAAAAVDAASGYMGGGGGDEQDSELSSDDEEEVGAGGDEAGAAADELFRSVSLERSAAANEATEEAACGTDGSIGDVAGAAAAADALFAETDALFAEETCGAEEGGASASASDGEPSSNNPFAVPASQHASSTPSAAESATAASAAAELFGELDEEPWQDYPEVSSGTSPGGTLAIPLAKPPPTPQCNPFDVADGDERLPAAAAAGSRVSSRASRHAALDSNPFGAPEEGAQGAGLHSADNIQILEASQQAEELAAKLMREVEDL